MWIGCLVNKSHIIIGKKFLNIKIGSGLGVKPNMVKGSDPSQWWATLGQGWNMREKLKKGNKSLLRLWHCRAAGVMSQS